MKTNRPPLAIGAALCCLVFAITPAFGQYARNRYALFLSDPPVIDRFGSQERLGATEAVAYRRQIETRQRTVIDALTARQIRVTGSVSVLLNAVFVTVEAGRVAEMAALPGVAGVVPMRRGKMALSTAVNLVNASTAWALSAIGGQANAGKGVKVGILDTGIDNNHAAFQDSTLTYPAGFPICTIGAFTLSGTPTNCPTPSLYTNTKVIVARSYVPQLAMDAVTNTGNPAAQSQPDDFTPRDHVGHGTAVASVVAGKSNSGGTVSFSGMAPKAYLGNYKIYGSPGVNDYFAEDVVIQALNDAVNDGMQVINFSSGAPALAGPIDSGAACGLSSGVPCDPLAAAFQNAANAGVVIAVAAGNSGVYNSISSPATAPAVIAVGATINSHSFGPQVVVPGTGQRISATASDSYVTTTGAITAPLVDASWVGDGYACTAYTSNTSLNGAIALVLRNLTTDANACSLNQKATNVQNAGAIGMILYNSSDNRGWNASQPTHQNYVESVYTFTGPLVGISNSDGVNLKTYIDSTAAAAYQAATTGNSLPAGNPWPAVTIDISGVEQAAQANANTLAYYSSLGPAFSSFPCSGCSILKPDMVAPGGGDPTISPDSLDTDSAGDQLFFGFSGMYMASQKLDANGEMYSSNGYIAADGTSFASPMVAGAAALVIQAKGYKGAQVKSALVNTANFSAPAYDDFGDASNVLWTGSGLLDAGGAAQANVVASPPTISFGLLSSGALPAAQTVTLTNLGTNSATVSMSPVGQITAATASVSVSPTSLTLAPNASGTFSVSLAGSTPTGASPYTGYIKVTGAGGTLNIPYAFMVGANSVGSYGTITPQFGTYFEVYPGQDAGAVPVQLLDQNGVPVVSSPVTFCVSNSSGTCLTSSGVTLKSATSSASASNSGANNPGAVACSPVSLISATCNSNSYGIAWVYIAAGASTPGTSSYVAVKYAGVVQSVMQFYIRAVPTILTGGVVDAAQAKTSIAPGSYIAIYGTGLADTAGQETTASLPMSLNNVTVSFDVPSANISVPGRLIYESPTQVNVQVPWELAGQTSAQIKVTLYESEYGSVVTVPVINTAPAFFEYSVGGSKSVAATAGNYYTFLSSSTPAQKGQKVSLYANGLGPVQNQPASGDPASSASTTPSSTVNTVTVTIGGQPATVTYAGLHPGTAGLYRVDVTAPSGLTSGAQAVSLSVLGQTATSTLYIQ